jgi:hypothetical protein
MTQIPTQEWWTAEEIAASGLPDLPATKRGVNQLIERAGWRVPGAHCRRRAGRGGGWEYSWTLFPVRAQRALLQRATVPASAAGQTREAAWSWFERLPQKVRERAQARLRVVRRVEALEPALGRNGAVAAVAREAAQGARTIWAWLALVEGVRADDRLPALAPRHRLREPAVAAAGGAGDGAASGRGIRDCDPAFFDIIRSDYLRLERPPFTDCYRRAVRVAREKGWDILPERTMRRRLDAAVMPQTQVLMREGVEAVRRRYPSQVRDKSALAAMEAVNADFHKFDVFVRWPGPPGEAAQIVRPQMVAFQDIHSGRILSWRVDLTPNATAVMLAAGDMIETWGIPAHVVLDNGREFAAKALTGGAPTRYRFKVREDDIPGLFVSLGCTVHWATPYSGQSKPIERAFRDLCTTISKDPRLAGAWTGNRPDAKPENYGSAAIDLGRFLGVVAEGIEEHNTREGRRSEVAWGRSFAAVFDESYAQAPVRKATAAQRRLWLLGAEGLRADRQTGAVRFQDNVYWAPWMQDVAGTRVVIRFDPADLWAGVHVYSAENAYLGEAACQQKAGFFDMDEARAHARARAAWLAAERRAAEAHRVYSAREIGALLDAAAPPPVAQPEAKVVRPLFGAAGRGDGAPAPASAPAPDVAIAQAAVVADLAARRAEAVTAEEPRERFRRALELGRAAAAGSGLTREQERWLAAYRTTAEYRGQKLLWDDYGDAMFG